MIALRLGVVVALAACSTSPARADPTGALQDAATAEATDPAETASAGSDPGGPGGEGSPAAAGGVTLDTVWRVVVTELVVRTEPGVADPATILHARLTVDDRVLVVDGPVELDGYAWYQVLPIRPDEARERPFGWIAAASREGEPWIAMLELDCQRPPDLAALLRLAPEERLACYGNETIEFAATADGGCGAAGGLPLAFEPRWLRSETGCGFGGRQPGSGWLNLRFPPNAAQGGSVTPGWRVIGHFDDPAARACTATANYPEVQPPTREEAVALCRTEFVVESLEPPG